MTPLFSGVIFGIGNGKQIFEHAVNVEEEQYQPKQEFHHVETKLDEPLEGELLEYST